MLLPTKIELNMKYGDVEIKTPIKKEIFLSK
jgi:hypothetical protein